MSSPRRLHRFVVPSLEGPVTGGTLFNRELIRALRELGEDIEVSTNVSSISSSPRPANVWVDSLFIDALPSMAAASHEAMRVGLVAHFLPSLLEHPTLTRAQLKPVERDALDVVEQFLVTSEYMASVLRALTAVQRPILIVEPGRVTPGLAPKPALSGVVRAVIVANLQPNKGLLPFLQALAARVRSGDRFIMQIVGHRGLAPKYAELCAQVVATTPLLKRQVEFLGEQSPARTIEIMRQSHVMVSASGMESYGMALAEARTLGVPLLAVAGGNVRSWISPDAGGELVGSHEELARAFLELCDKPGQLEARIAAARRTAVAPRSWSAAAAEYLRVGSAITA